MDYVGAWDGVPVAFDAKSAEGRASYAHDPKKRHELEFLERFRAAGGLAFLLVRDAALGRVYCVADLAPLLAGESVPLRVDLRDGGAPLVPCLARPDAHVAVALVTGRPVWDWRELVRAVELPARRAA